MRNKFLCALLGACMLLGTNPALRGQQAQTSPDTVRLKQHPLRYDQSLGAAAASLGEGRLRQIDVTLIEIAPGGKLAAHRHLAEEMLYIVAGNGYTLMWAGQEGKTAGKKELKYEWKEGDLLSPSLNAWHQHWAVAGSKWYWGRSRQAPSASRWTAERMYSKTVSEMK